MRSSGDHLEIICGSSGARLPTQLVLIRVSFGAHLGVVWCSSGNHLVIIWESYGVIWGSSGDHMGIIRGSSGGHLILGVKSYRLMILVSRGALYIYRMYIYISMYERITIELDRTPL